ncbi:MAG: right-handed parallel beta-helix repeat-containing protein [Candidatus Krumholzibacteria bacterium]|nr:right-handed parallel beta-helix repeat-containing protein [Candidatus Krumholzibacteria bacterium]
MSINRMGAGLAAGLALLAISAAVSSAAVITVRSDGTGDFTTIAAAVAASSAGDEIEIGPGTYSEPDMIVTHDLTIRSTDGPATTTVTAAARIFRFVGPQIEVEGIRFTASNNPNHGALAFVQGAQGVVRDCVFDNNLGGALGAGTAATVDISACTFRDNSYVTSGGALYVSGPGSQMTVESCLFEDNTAPNSGGAIAVAVGARLTAIGCTFRNNTAGIWGGAVHVMETSVGDLSQNVFVSNEADVGSAVYSYYGLGTIASNTFHANRSADAYNATVYLQDSQTLFARNIVSGDPLGAGLAILYGFVTHECNLYWQNGGGAVRYEELSPSERELDPVYCDPGAGDLTVSLQGAAAPAQSACGVLIGALPTACDIPPPPPPSDAPIITDISDVPNDQGRQVRMKWTGSAQDHASADPPVLGYAIYRHEGMITPELLARLRAATSRAPGVVAIEGWDYLLTAPARGDDVYQTIVATTCDYTHRHGMCLNAFFVSAITASPAVFWDSEPDTGYSVDNLPPGPPHDFLVTMGASGGNRLEWQAADENDVADYGVYRGSGADFVCSPDNRVAVTGETAWVDAGGGAYDYKVTAFDESGNESEASSPVLVTGAGAVPAAFALDQNVPNPFNPTTRIRYSLAAGGDRVTLRVFDVNGRLVRTLVDGVATAGPNDVIWDGRDDAGSPAASGVYFYRLEAPGFAQTRKMALIR